MMRREEKEETCNEFVKAIASIPEGQTRSFRELAEMAGKAGAARAAGRAVAACPFNSNIPWHRVISSQGGLSKVPGRSAYQLQRLQEEGARPASGESNCDWAHRMGIKFIGCYAQKDKQWVYVSAKDQRADLWPATVVEQLQDESAAATRGFRHIDVPALPEPPLPRCIFENWENLPKVELTTEVRLARLDWGALNASLTSEGYCHISSFLSKREVAEVLTSVESAVKDVDGSHKAKNCGGIDRIVDLSRFGGGYGRYYYLRDPLPGCIGSLRNSLYNSLVEHANFLQLAAESEGVNSHFKLQKRMKTTCYTYPPSLDKFLEECRHARQTRPSVILLCYGKGGKNLAHRDIYGSMWHPLQAMVMLSEDTDYQGGSFFLEIASENNGVVSSCDIPCKLGDLLIFCSNYHLKKINNHNVKFSVRHGMHSITSGQRFALGIPFHLAK